MPDLRNCIITGPDGIKYILVPMSEAGSETQIHFLPYKFDPKLKIGPQITEARSKANRVSLRKIAEEANITAAALCRIEKGDTDPQENTLNAIAIALGIRLGLKA